MTNLRPSLKSAQRFALGWSYLNDITSGKSAIDLGALGLRDIDDARQFARAYGFDLDQPGDLEQIRLAHREALQFIVSSFLDEGEAELIPPEVADPVDVLQLLVYASRHVLHADPRRMWSCAVLKVMHCVFYIDNNLKLRHFNAIRQQVFAGLDEVLRSEGDRHFLSDGEICLPLRVCEKKSNKGRRSILLKLLQKAAYVAADISDHLGLRLVFETRIECLLALRVLQRAQLVSVINIEPQRTRNTLLDVLTAREVFNEYRERLDAADDYPLDLLREMDRELIARANAQERRDNPHSASGYHSLQVTVRKMIHLDDSAGSESGGKFYFEYEIQMMDRASYESSKDGPASHSAYKQRQVDTARRRVFGNELLGWLQQQRSGLRRANDPAAATGSDDPHPEPAEHGMPEQVS